MLPFWVRRTRQHQFRFLPPSVLPKRGAGAFPTPASSVDATLALVLLMLHNTHSILPALVLCCSEDLPSAAPGLPRPVAGVCTCACCCRFMILHFSINDQLVSYSLYFAGLRLHATHSLILTVLELAISTVLIVPVARC